MSKCPPLKSASHDSGITYDSDCIGEYFEAEDVSRPSTAFASAEEDEADKSSEWEMERQNNGDGRTDGQAERG